MSTRPLRLFFWILYKKASDEAYRKTANPTYSKATFSPLVPKPILRNWAATAPIKINRFPTASIRSSRASSLGCTSHLHQTTSTTHRETTHTRLAILRNDLQSLKHTPNNSLSSRLASKSISPRCFPLSPLQIMIKERLLSQILSQIGLPPVPTSRSRYSSRKLPTSWKTSATI
ncbi:hypothetical protein BU24DRAFT_151802 [Aaosphaeria arxii CBS 175.79]|uniref:Uncharacterized protein n=1 Tax=Aaosphaeria arxii CBS 175.79 TaxID=1450172 RepID=A0A6A5XXE1_9PLEO|nr:uncharacterized protein BU24DRAFT_151802 [Aaosphaeria arxii CBS 175.79]KAF2017487.1 hypothetical protein BU24DRAFT_151802 [Aaosphaeria arxii CBS 175.79]